MPPTAADIRRDFLEFFEKRDHAFAPSSPVVPHDDPTLLFANAGMNQFKDVFLGQGSRPYTRAVNSQKCIRAGGKHNDLEDVGKDTYHHTFFEMLGNWSFGDYFKQEAIDWAWELLTEVWGLEKERLHVTVFAGDVQDGLEPDLEAERLWAKHIPAERISRWDKKDNFWEMGETGPCGPCSEIHYDFTPDRSGGGRVNADDPDVIEIWNLVFIQFNRAAGGVLSPLPHKHVDTGMGLERVVRVLQGKTSNYDTDLWSGIFDEISTNANVRPYSGALEDPIDVAYRIIADHVRCLTMAICDGAWPSNEGRGYVLRRILRRAVRVARQQFDVSSPLLCKLVPAVVESLGGAFPELQHAPDKIASIVREEEVSFLRTLDRGLALFEDAAAHSTSGGSTEISAEDAFKLHDTYGFPIDLTRVMAEERGFHVDEPGYETLMSEARERSRHKAEHASELTLPPDAIGRLESDGVVATDVAARDAAAPMTARIAAVWDGAAFAERVDAGADVGVVLDRTNHYAEAGGQVGDHGTIQTADGGQASVRSTMAVGPYVLHIADVTGGALQVGAEVDLAVDLDRRRPTMSNHTATHLLNHALRDVLGDEINQRGSLVAPDRLRFDFSHGQGMTEDEVSRVETAVREAIARDLSVHAEVVPLEDARKVHGLRAVFGERYPDPVRVVSIGPAVSELLASPENTVWRGYSVEFCGGTHLVSTGAAKAFVILSEGALAAGVRRITALTGAAAEAAEAAAAAFERSLDHAERLDGDGLLERAPELQAEFDELTIGATARAKLAPRMDTLRDRAKEIRKQAQGAARSGVVDQARAIADADVGPVIVAAIDGADKETLLSAMDVLKAKHPESAAMLFAPDPEEGKVAICAVVPKSLIGAGLKAGDWVREAAKTCGGGGGGRPDMAQAGGKDPSRVPDAIEVSRAFAENAIS